MSQNNKSESVLTIERIYEEPALNGRAPVRVQFSPNGELVTFLKGKSEDIEVYDLHAFSLKTGQSFLLVDSATLDSDTPLSDEEKARRERFRWQGKGIFDYVFSPNSDGLIFPVGGKLYYHDLNTKKTKSLGNPGFATDVKFSPDGRFVSFVSDHDLHMIDIKTGELTPLTTDGTQDTPNATAEYIAQEEMHRYTGYWWSPDAKQIVFTQTDLRDIPVSSRYEIDGEDFKVFKQRYSFAGGINAKISLAHVAINSQKITRLNADLDGDVYLARVKWLPSSEAIAYQRQTRDLHTLEVRYLDLATNKAHTVLSETSETWVNIHDDWQFLKDSEQFIWSSERNDLKQLWLYNFDGKKIRQLTDINYPMHEVLSLDEDNQAVYFLAGTPSPIDRGLCKLDLKNGVVTRVSQQAGWHDIVLDKTDQYYLDRFSDPNTPTQVAVHKISGERVLFVEENRLDKTHPYYPYLDNHAAPTFGTLKAQDDQTLFYRLYKPVDFDPTKKYPVIVDVYGGPGAQLVINSFVSSHHFWHQVMANKGYVIFSLDNRGSTNRGKRFEDPIDAQLGEVELQDQLTGVEFLKQQSFVDADRIGVFGWSYGGYMTLMSMFKAPEIFKVGVSVAPVTDWALYDTHYTERFLNHPKSNKDGYEASSVFPYLENLKGDLLVIHGMADDNVLFTHSTKLFHALQQARKPFYQMNYPGAKHGISGRNNQIHVYNAITNFFDENL